MDKIDEFLYESNAIEDVWDEDSLKQARYAWNYLICQPSITTSSILKTHKILMLHQSLRPDEKGYFRRRDVWIGGHKAMPSSEIRDKIRDWCKQIKKSKTDEEIKQDHIAYEAIHPFIDGNGRTGRIFLNWQRIKAGLPILVIKEEEKYDYYDWFK